MTRIYTTARRHALALVAVAVLATPALGGCGAAAETDEDIPPECSLEIDESGAEYVVCGGLGEVEQAQCSTGDGYPIMTDYPVEGGNCDRCPEQQAAYLGALLNYYCKPYGILGGKNCPASCPAGLFAFTRRDTSSALGRPSYTSLSRR